MEGGNGRLRRDREEENGEIGRRIEGKQCKGKRKEKRTEGDGRGDEEEEERRRRYNRGGNRKEEGGD